MPSYLFSAKSPSGETRSGTIVAKDEQALALQLRSEGFLVTSIKRIEPEAAKQSIGLLARFSSVPLKEKLVFTRNLSVMVTSGLPMGRALQNLSSQTAHKRFQKIIKSLHQDVQKGLTLSDGLAKHPGVFNDLFVNMIRVGEVGGSLEEVLDIITIQMEKDHDLISKVKGAFTYPAVIVVAMIGVGIVMLTYILPQILSVFEDMNVTLPASTRAIIAISDVLTAHPILLLAGVFGFFIFMRFFIKTETGKITISTLSLKLPVIGGIIVKVNSARFARIYSSLLRSGVSVVDALTIVSRTLGNYYYRKALTDAVGKVQKGVELSDIIKQNPKIFPIIVPQMLQVGEETGKTEEMMQKLAEFYEAEVDQITRNLSSIIEPVLMIIIGSAVGFFAVAMLKPMYSILENIQ